MALGPVPLQAIRMFDYQFQDWLRQLRTQVGGGSGGTIPWSNLDFTGSNITDILTRNHNNLQNIFGGAVNDYYHLTQAQNTELAGLVTGMSGTGLAARTADDTWTARTLTAPAAGFTITNGGGVAGNPTFTLADDLAGVEGIGGTGLATRTAANTWTTRTITAGTGISVSDGDGVSGNPTIATTLTLDSGTYTPTLTNTTNIDSSTAYSCQYSRVGSTVTVSGKVDVDATASGTSTILGMSLPIASNFANTNELSGVGVSINAAGVSGIGIYGDTTNDRATFDWFAGNTVNRSIYFTFTYRII